MAEDEAVKELQDAIRCDEAKAKSLLESAGGNVDSALELYFIEKARADGTRAEPASVDDDDTSDAVDGLLSTAKPSTESTYLAARAAKAAQQAFGGSGFRLDGAASGDSSKPAAQDAGGASQADSVSVPLAITFYGNAFTVDDDETWFDNDSPEGKQILADLQRGGVPAGLHQIIQAKAPKNTSIVVDIMLTDKRDRKFTPPPPRLKTFSGAGHALGGGRGPSQASVGRATAAGATDEGAMNVGGATDLWRQFCSRELWSRLYELASVLFSLLWTLTTFSEGGKAADAAEGYELIVDEEQPTTTLKVQLADGSRHEATFNEQHTVFDVIRYAETLGADRTRLQTGFPPKKLMSYAVTKEGQDEPRWPTLRQASLVSCRVVELAAPAKAKKE